MVHSTFCHIQPTNIRVKINSSREQSNEVYYTKNAIIHRDHQVRYIHILLLQKGINDKKNCGVSRS